MRTLGWIQHLLLVIGLLLLGIYVGAHIHRAIMSRAELRRFEDVQAKPHADKADIVLSLSGLNVSFDLWSPKRYVGCDWLASMPMRDTTPNRITVSRAKNMAFAR